MIFVLTIAPRRDIITRYHSNDRSYGWISKWGRCRALPVADKARHKEWQRSKFCERERAKNSGTATGHNEAEPRKFNIEC